MRCTGAYEPDAPCLAGSVDSGPRVTLLWVLSLFLHLSLSFPSCGMRLLAGASHYLTAGGPSPGRHWPRTTQPLRRRLGRPLGLSPCTDVCWTTPGPPARAHMMPPGNPLSKVISATLTWSGRDSALGLPREGAPQNSPGEPTEQAPTLPSGRGSQRGAPTDGSPRCLQAQQPRAPFCK